MVIAASWVGMLQRGDYYRLGDPEQRPLEWLTPQTEWVLQGFQAQLAELTAAGKHVVLKRRLPPCRAGSVLDPKSVIDRETMTVRVRLLAGAASAQRARRAHRADRPAAQAHRSGRRRERGRPHRVAVHPCRCARAPTRAAGRSTRTIPTCAPASRASASTPWTATCTRAERLVASAYGRANKVRGAALMILYSEGKTDDRRDPPAAFPARLGYLHRMAQVDLFSCSTTCSSSAATTRTAPDPHERRGALAHRAGGAALAEGAHRRQGGRQPRQRAPVGSPSTSPRCATPTARPSFFGAYAPALKQIFETRWTRLVDLNAARSTCCAKRFRIRTPLVRSSRARGRGRERRPDPEPLPRGGRRHAARRLRRLARLPRPEAFAQAGVRVSSTSSRIRNTRSAARSPSSPGSPGSTSLCNCYAKSRLLFKPGARELRAAA